MPTRRTQGYQPGNRDDSEEPRQTGSMTPFRKETHVAFPGEQHSLEMTNHLKHKTVDVVKQSTNSHEVDTLT